MWRLWPFDLQILIRVKLSIILQKEFTKKNEELAKKFGMLQKYEQSQEFLVANPDLVCEETANYLVIWCIDLEIEEVSQIKYALHQRM